MSEWVEARPWRELRPIRELRRVPWDELAIDERTKLKRWYRGTYLRTKGWHARRDAAKRAAGGCCERCGVKGTGRQHPASVLHVHHRSYDHLGAEQWPRDLEVVCAACHRAEHGVQL